MKNKNLTPLVIEAQKGNQKALNDLIESCYNDIYYFALKTVKKEDIAADVTQDACLKIIQSLDKLNDPAAFKSWALRITYNFCAMHFRAAKDILVDENEDGETIFDTLADDSEDAQPDKAYENAEFKEMMRDMIESLPAEQASALMLYYYEKVSVKEIAEIHGVSEGTVKSRLNYGRKAVKEKVGDYEKRTGIRLHSITPLPLLLAWFFAQSAEKAPAAVAGAISSSVAGAAGAAGATAAGVSAATATAATAATTAGATAATATAVAAKAGVSALAAKVIAIVVGAALAVSAAVGGIYIATNNSDTEITEEDNGGENSGENYGDNGNENSGNNKPAHTHTYDNGFCTVCGEAKLSEGLEFTLNDDGESYSVTGIGTCTDTDIVIPSTYEGKPVTGIGKLAFASCKTLKSVTIPNGVTSIGDKAFFAHYSLTSINIPDSVTSIGYSAFSCCTSLTNVTIGNSVTAIGESAFKDCTSLATISIPDSVTSIGDFAFENCSSLASIVVDPNNKVYHSSGNCLIETASKTLVVGCKASVIPSDRSVTSIGDKAFWDCKSLTSITIPDSVTSIGWRAFSRCTSLTSITIPDSVTSIDSYAFDGCTSLKYNEYKNGKYLGNSNNPCVVLCDVINTGVSSFEINARTKVIGDSAFEDCDSLKSITIPDSVTSIGYSAFSGCYWLKSVTIPGSVMIISSDAFRGCTSLTSITIPDSVTDIGLGVFIDCTSLKYNEYKNGKYLGNSNNPYVLLCGVIDTGVSSFEINANTKFIGYSAFNGCTSLTSVTIGNGVTSIGDWAFDKCSSLTSITIPDSVTSIGFSLFEGCTSLTSIVVDKNNKVYHSAGNCIIETASKTLVAGCKSSVIPSDGSVTSIGDYAFEGCTSLTSITIPDSVTSIGNYAFSHCTSLTSITIPNSVTSIGRCAFAYSSKLTSITIPDSVAIIGEMAFDGCGLITRTNFNGPKAQ